MKPIFANLFVILAMLAATVVNAYEVGEQPYDRLGHATGGDEIFLSDGKGQIQVVTFWATWCAPCRKELPVLAAIKEQEGAKDVRVYAINLKEDRKVYRKSIKAFEDYNLTFLHDRRGRLASKFGVEGIPHMLIIGRDGLVAHKHVGYGETTIYEIVKELNALLSAPVIAAETGAVQPLRTAVSE